MGKKEGENVYILATSVLGGQFYLGKCFHERGKKRPALTFVIGRAKRYRTLNAAIKDLNALVEKYGYMLVVIDAADFEGRGEVGIRSPDPRP